MKVSSRSSTERRVVMPCVVLITRGRLKELERLGGPKSKMRGDRYLSVSAGWLWFARSYDAAF